MINKIPYLKGIIKKLPSDIGTVEKVSRVDGNGETQRVLAVSYRFQTILFEFVFDDLEEREIAYAEFLAKAPSIINEMIDDYSSQEKDFQTILDAFNTVCGKYETLNARYKALLEQSKPNEDDYPTVGEK